MSNSEKKEGCIKMNRLDFVLKENEDERLLFRIYKEGTRVHSFNENPPVSWEKVYKVYYEWGIIKQYLDENGKVESSERLFYMPCDECSMIPGLSGIIAEVMKTGKIFDAPTLGQPAGEWEIRRKKNPIPGYGKYYCSFIVFDNWKNTGYRFSLREEKIKEFIVWLEKMEEITLKECGCPI